MILFEYLGTIYRAGITLIKRLDSSVIRRFDYLGCVSFGDYLSGYRSGAKVERETSNRQITPETTHAEVCGNLSIGCCHEPSPIRDLQRNYQSIQISTFFNFLHNHASRGKATRKTLNRCSTREITV